MTPTLATEARVFLDAVRAELADLPEEDVAELLEDVEQHLAEASADGRLAELGSPAAYAAELRGAAGLPARATGRSRWALLRSAQRRAERLAATRAYQEVRAFAPELRPAWWVARGYLVVALLAFWTHDSVREVVPIPRVSGNVLLGLLATGGAIVASVAWGRREPVAGRGRRIATRAANVVAVVAALAILNDVGDVTYAPHYDYVSYPPGLVNGPYGQVTEIYPYDAEGRPLDGVRLYDQEGNALAPMVCDRFCPRLSFPLHDTQRGPLGPDSDYRLTTSTPTATASATPSTTPSATPAAKPSVKPSGKPTRAPSPTRSPR